MAFTFKNNSQWDRFIKQTRATPHYIHWCLIFIFALTLYIVTLAPDLVWQDQGDYQYQAAKCILKRPGDAVRVHPLFIITAHTLGRIGLFSFAYAANLVSAIFTAVTVANIYLLMFLLVGRIWPAALSAFTFALAHSVWFLGVQAQTYGMANAAMTTGLLLLLAYQKSGKTEYLLWMGFAFGLGLSTHLMSQIAFVIIMAWLLLGCWKKRLSILAFLGVLGFWAAGAGLFWMVLVLEYQHCGDLGGVVKSAVWGKWGYAVFNWSRLGFLLKQSVLFFILNFPTPLVLLALPGFYFSLSRRCVSSLTRLLAISTLAYGLFAVRYDVPNQNNFFLPMYLFVSIYIGLGFAYVFQRWIKFWSLVTAVLLLAIPPTYIGISYFAHQHDIQLGVKRHIPYRDACTYYLIPWQHKQTGPRQFAYETLMKTPKNAVILADKTTLPPLQYLHEIEKVRQQDIQIVLRPNKTKMRELRPPGERVFTISNVEGYYPYWVQNPAHLIPFPISPTEHIFEIPESECPDK